MALAGGDVRLTNLEPDHLAPVSAVLREMGVTVDEEDAAVSVIATALTPSVTETRREWL